MPTSPVLGRREIPRKERLQQSLTVLAITGASLIAAWYLVGDWLRDRPVVLLCLGLAGALGITTNPSGTNLYTANSAFETVAALTQAVFADGFESGNLTAWSASVP